MSSQSVKGCTFCTCGATTVGRDQRHVVTVLICRGLVRRLPAFSKFSASRLFTLHHVMVAAKGPLGTVAAHTLVPHIELE